MNVTRRKNALEKIDIASLTEIAKLKAKLSQAAGIPISFSVSIQGGWLTAR